MGETVQLLAGAMEETEGEGRIVDWLLNGKSVWKLLALTASVTALETV